MKVLVLIEASVPSRYWSSALPLLKEKGIEVSFATIRAKGELSENLEENHIPVFAFDANRARDYPRAVWRLARLVKTGGFDIIHACESISASISGVSAYLTRRKAIRLFHRQHNACPQNTRFFHNLANRTSDFMMTCSCSTKNFASEEDGFDSNRIQVAYNGIDPLRNVEAHEVSAIRQQLGIPENARVISIVARLRKEKGHRTLFKAAKRVADSIADPIHVVVTGDGYDGESLKTDAKQFDNFKIHFSGHQEDIAPWFAIGEIVVMPSYSEPFGIVAAEAMSSGRPLIASGVDGLKEVVEGGISGILVPPKDEKALADGIVKLLEDPELGKRLAANGLRRVQNYFSMEKMVEGWINCYQTVIKD